MIDPRVERLAALICDHGVELGEGDVIRIDGAECAASLASALYRAALARGANPYVDVLLSGLEAIMLAEGSTEQLEAIAPVEWEEVETIDALVTIWSDENTHELSRVDPARRSRRLAARRKLSTRRWQRMDAGEMRWCGTLSPTNGHAQDAEMSLADYEDFVFRACHVADPAEDAAAFWRGRSAELSARAAALAGVRELRLVGPETDLRVGVAGRTWIPADGRHNMPDGEVFTSPVETETAGDIRFAFPAVFEGREVEDVRLRFEGGRVVAAEAAAGEEYLCSLLDMDAGARVLGEVAFGLNYEIDRFTHNILFDEKIGGTMHVALGAAFARAGGANTSGLHWDLICDLREGGEVFADGELIWRDGRFLDEVDADG